MQYILFTVFLELLSCFQYLDLLECKDLGMKNGIFVPSIGYDCKLALQFLLFSQWRETFTSKSLKALKVQDPWYEENRLLGIDCSVWRQLQRAWCVSLVQLGLNSQSGSATCKYKVLESELKVLWGMQTHSSSTSKSSCSLYLLWKPEAGRELEPDEPAFLAAGCSGWLQGG